MVSRSTNHMSKHSHFPPLEDLGATYDFWCFQHVVCANFVGGRILAISVVLVGFFICFSVDNLVCVGPVDIGGAKRPRNFLKPLSWKVSSSLAVDSLASMVSRP